MGGAAHSTYELDVIRRLYPTGGLDAVQAALPNRTRKALQNMAYKVGVVLTDPKRGGARSTTEWTTARIERLLRFVHRDPSPTAAEVAAAFGITEDAAASAINRYVGTRAAVNRDGAKLIKCLCCDRQFVSAGIHNRQCPNCRRANGFTGDV